VVIATLAIWEKMQSKGFFIEGKGLIEVVAATMILFVWIVFAIVAIVYAEVILEEDPEESACPGRVASSTDNIEQSTRKLSVAYQSVVIFFSFVLALLFLISTVRLTRMAKNMSKAKMFAIREGSLIVFTFLLRSVLFIIILAVDFASSIYMFITLFITEVLLIFLSELFFNWHVATSIAKALAPGGKSTSSSHSS